MATSPKRNISQRSRRIGKTLALNVLREQLSEPEMPQASPMPPVPPVPPVPTGIVPPEIIEENNRLHHRHQLDIDRIQSFIEERDAYGPPIFTGSMTLARLHPPPQPPDANQRAFAQQVNCGGALLSLNMMDTYQQVTNGREPDELWMNYNTFQYYLGLNIQLRTAHAQIVQPLEYRYMNAIVRRHQDIPDGEMVFINTSHETFEGMVAGSYHIGSLLPYSRISAHVRLFNFTIEAQQPQPTPGTYGAITREDAPLQQWKWRPFTGIVSTPNTPEAEAAADAINRVNEYIDANMDALTTVFGGLDPLALGRRRT